jgi:acyl-coenzyme A thioesterase PaaI-like protein
MLQLIYKKLIKKRKPLMDFNTLRRIPPRERSSCFGCGTENISGLMMKFYTDEIKLYSKVTVPDHLGGWDNIVHGGVISTMLDEIMSWSAIHILKRFILTKSIAVNFYRPVKLGDELIIEGEVGERINEREAVMKGRILNAEGVVCTDSSGVFALFTMEAIKKLGIATEHSIETMKGIIE